MKYANRNKFHADYSPPRIAGAVFLQLVRCGASTRSKGRRWAQFPSGGGFVRGCKIKYVSVVADRPHDLQTERQPITVAAHRQADRRASGKVGQQREGVLVVRHHCPESKRG